eukprot:scaffold95526_cov21-Cyclotella_meneghiniana.AAC.3
MAPLLHCQYRPRRDGLVAPHPPSKYPRRCCSNIAVIQTPSCAAEPRLIQATRPPPDPDSKCHTCVATSRKRIVVSRRCFVVSRGSIVMCLIRLTISNPTNKSISPIQMSEPYGTYLEDEFENEI